MKLETFVIRNAAGFMLNKDHDEWTPDVEHAAWFDYFCVAEALAARLGLDPRVFRIETVATVDCAATVEYVTYADAFPYLDPRD